MTVVRPTSTVEDDEALPIGPYTFHPSTKALLKRQNGQRVRLTSREVTILKFLYLAGNRVVPHEVLLKEVWGYNTEGTKHALQTYVYRLRQALEADPKDRRLLITVPGGYRLDATAAMEAGTLSAEAEAA